MTLHFFLVCVLFTSYIIQANCNFPKIKLKNISNKDGNGPCRTWLLETCWKRMTGDTCIREATMARAYLKQCLPFAKSSARLNIRCIRKIITEDHDMFRSSFAVCFELECTCFDNLLTLTFQTGIGQSFSIINCTWRSKESWWTESRLWYRKYHIWHVSLFVTARYSSEVMEPLMQVSRHLIVCLSKLFKIAWWICCFETVACGWISPEWAKILWDTVTLLASFFWILLKCFILAIQIVFITISREMSSIWQFHLHIDCSE